MRSRSPGVPLQCGGGDRGNPCKPVVSGPLDPFGRGKFHALRGPQNPLIIVFLLFPSAQSASNLNLQDFPADLLHVSFQRLSDSLFFGLGKCIPNAILSPLELLLPLHYLALESWGILEGRTVFSGIWRTRRSGDHSVGSPPFGSLSLHGRLLQSGCVQLAPAAQVQL